MGILSWSSAPTAAPSDLGPIISELREQVRQDLDPARLGAGYAALINFAANPDISTATYHIDSDTEGANDPKLEVFRLPLRHVIELDGRAWRPFVQANFAHQIYDVDFVPFGDDERISNTWKAQGGSLATGAELPLSEGLTLVPALNLGLVRLESDARYKSRFGNAILKPAFEGLVFDWDAEAWLAGVSVGADYERPFRHFDLNLHGSLTYNHVETYDSSSGLIDFDSQATTFFIQADTIHPTGLSLDGYPLALVAHVGNTTFLGDERDALGFEYFFEAGLALETDVSRKEWPVKKLRFGAKAIYGEDVTGWGVMFGYRF